MTFDQLCQIMPYAGPRAVLFLAGLNATMTEFNINTPLRQASFLAQVGHESGQLKYLRELASGDAYDRRKDLGNTKPAAIEIAARKGGMPGHFYRGGGLLEITGYDNYLACGIALGVDLVNRPELLETPLLACRSAGWFWSEHGLNELADKGNQVAVTKRINGGTNGLADRLALFAVAEKVLA
jgi:putative chitinase